MDFLRLPFLSKDIGMVDRQFDKAAPSKNCRAVAGEQALKRWLIIGLGGADVPSVRPPVCLCKQFVPSKEHSSGQPGCSLKESLLRQR